MKFQAALRWAGLCLFGALLVYAPETIAQVGQTEATEPPKAVPDSVALNPGPWQEDLILGAGLTQSTFSGNWSGGDTGAISWTGRIDFLAERQFNTKFNWKNTLLLSYGQTAEQERDPNDANNLVWQSAEKNTDLIGFQSVGRWTLGNWADPYAAFTLDSQFEDESSPLGTINFNPFKFKESAGLAKVFKKTETRELISRLGVGMRQTVGKSFLPGPPVTKQSFSANDGGFEWYTNVKEPLAGGRITYRGDLLVFAPLFYSKSSDLELYDAQAADSFATHRNVQDDWKVPDVNWRNWFSSKITKVITVDLFVQLVYDKFDTAANLDPANGFPAVDSEVRRNSRLAGQFKQTLALGFTLQAF